LVLLLLHIGGGVHSRLSLHKDMHVIVPNIIILDYGVKEAFVEDTGAVDPTLVT